MSERAGEGRGVVLFAHGSREPSWREPFLKMERLLAEKLGGTAVRAAFLKECEPGLFEAVDEMVSSGVSRITVIPVFLAVGAHSANDFPAISRRIAEEHPGAAFTWTQVIGQWDETIAALAAVMAEKIGG